VGGSYSLIAVLGSRTFDIIEGLSKKMCVSDERCFMNCYKRMNTVVFQRVNTVVIVK
jgi:hypothetical protein